MFGYPVSFSQFLVLLLILYLIFGDPMIHVWRYKRFKEDMLIAEGVIPIPYDPMGALLDDWQQKIRLFEATNEIFKDIHKRLGNEIYANKDVLYTVKDEVELIHFHLYRSKQDFLMMRQLMELSEKKFDSTITLIDKDLESVQTLIATKEKMLSDTARDLQTLHSLALNQFSESETQTNLLRQELITIRADILAESHKVVTECQKYVDGFVIQQIYTGLFIKILVDQAKEMQNIQQQLIFAVAEIFELKEDLKREHANLKLEQAELILEKDRIYRKLRSIGQLVDKSKKKSK